MSYTIPAPNDSPDSHVPDLVALATALQAALDVFVPFIRDGIPAQRENTGQGTSSYAPMSGEETRSYRLSPQTVREEKEYLRHSGAEDTFDLAWKAFNRLSVVVSLLEQTSPDQDLPRDFLQQLGEELRDALCALEKALDFLTDMELVHTRTIE